MFRRAGFRPRPPALLIAAMLAAGCSAGPPPETTGTHAPTTTAQQPTTTAGASSTLDIQGHRGARGLLPESTLPGFETALDLMVTTLELDLHWSADDRLVVWHDPAVSADKCRIEAGSSLPDPDQLEAGDAALAVRNLTSSQLRSYICDRNPDPSRFPDQEATPTPMAGDDFGIITLDELFDFVETYAAAPEKTDEQRAAADAVQFNIETKRVPDRPETIGDGFDGEQPGPFELAVLELIDRLGLEGRTVVQSFDHRSLRAIRSANPTVRLAALTSRLTPDFDAYVAFGAAIWSPNYRDLNSQRLDQAHERGLLVIPWTVNDPDDIATMIGLGVDGIISDRPDLVPRR